MKIDGFTFYKVKKNEDANPCVHKGERDGFIAVADGLGGSGSFVHELSSYDNKLKERFMRTFLPEYFDKNHDGTLTRDETYKKWYNFEIWLNKLIAPVVDNIPDTSALWGSRIAIARFVHYLLYKKPDADFSDENERQDIVEYIYSGMKDTVREFSLKTDSNEAQLRLPTTLVGLKYKILDDEQIFVETVWAGDSRAYALVPDLGLKQLTQDDEDGSGAISNLFCIMENGDVPNTKLNYASYNLPEKSIVFVCSDGIFDPYEPIDNIGVEAVFLDCLSRSNNFEELNDNWLEHFKPLDHDDCSVAFLAFGYDSFDDLKSLFESRKEEVTTAFNDYSDLKKFIPIIVEGSEETPEVYIRERAQGRKEEIAKKFAAEIITNPNSANDLIAPRLYALYEELERERQESAKKKEERDKAEASKTIIEYLLNNPNKMHDIFKQNAPEELISRFDKSVASEIRYIMTLANNLKTKADKYEAAKTECSDNEQLLIDALAERDWLTISIAERQEKISDAVHAYDEAYKWTDRIYQANIDGYGEEREETLWEKKRRDYYKAQKDTAEKYYAALSNLIKFLEDEKIPSNYSFVCYPLDAHFRKEAEDAINTIVELKRSNERANKALPQAQKDFDSAWKDYQQKVRQSLDKSMLRLLIDQPNVWFTEGACREFKLPILLENEAVGVDALKAEILDYFDKYERAFNELIRKFMDSSSPSIIDSIFNEKRLILYREYQSVDHNRVRAANEKADELISESKNVAEILANKA